jgi:hypothetical protein
VMRYDRYYYNNMLRYRENITGGNMPISIEMSSRLGHNVHL